MPFDSYTAFRTSVLTWLDVSDLGTTIVDDLIVIGENKINREIKSREMETVFSQTISAGAIPVPENLMELKSVYIDGTPIRKLDRISLDAMYVNYPTRSSTTKPNSIAREGSNYIFGPYPDSAYTVKGVYYQTLSPLATTLHTLFSHNEDLYLFAALSEAEAVIGRDNRVAMWEAKYQAAKERVNQEDWDEAASGGLTIRRG